MTDECLTLARSDVVDLEPLVELGLKFSGLTARTPPERIEQATRDELGDLADRALAELERLDAPERGSSLATEVEALLRSTRAHLAAGGDGLNRGEVERLLTRARPEMPSVAGVLEKLLERHRALEQRLGWLLRGTPRAVRESLDPAIDSDRIHHAMISEFRFESRVLETLAINRIAQSPTVGTFFRSTRQAETNAVTRFFDTYALYANIFEWGLDSLRGRRAVERMNQIHGRYYIPNDEMKFALLQGAFTWLDGAGRIAHRRVSDIERRAMVTAWVRMGRAMNIQELSDDYDEMYGWFREVCRATREYSDIKKSTFTTIVEASLENQPDQLRDGIFLAARAAMDDTYREAVGYDEPSESELAAVRAVFFTVGGFIESLPYRPHLRSLQNNPARRTLTDPMSLGANDRSRFMPIADADRKNAGFPEWQVPLRPADVAAAMDLPAYSWSEIAANVAAGRVWLVIDGDVYDLTVMVDVHPGGGELIRRWVGQDATLAFREAKHSAGAAVFSLNYRVGRLRDDVVTARDLRAG